MHRKLPAFLSVALGALLLVAPSLSSIGSHSMYDSAYAAKGGNGKGNSGGKGNGANSNANGGVGSASATGGNNGNGKGNGKSASAGMTASGKTKTKSVASQLGALNAAHASAQAFADAAPNSRVGRIKSYAVQAAAATALNTAAAAVTTAAAELAAAQTNLTDVMANPLATQVEIDAATLRLSDAQTAYANSVTTATAAAVDQAVTDAAVALATAQTNLAANPLDPTLAAAVTTAQADYDTALAAAVTAANTQTTTLLDGATNKPMPLSPEAQQQLDSLLAGKIDATGADPTP